MSFEPGEVVKKTGEEQLMTVFRLLGGEESSALEMLDNKYINQGFTQGDPMCHWFVGQDLQSGTFHSGELEKVNLKPAGASEDLDAELDDLDVGDEAEEDLNLDDFDF